MGSVRTERGAPGRRRFILCIGVVAMLSLEAHASGAPMRPGSVGFGCGPGATEEAVAALPTYRCRRTLRPIRVDEMWEDAGWRPAASTGPFLTGTPAACRNIPTEARLTYDDRTLYIAFRCADRDIYSPYQNRDDSLWNEDVVELFLRHPRRPPPLLRIRGEPRECAVRRPDTQPGRAW